MLQSLSIRNFVLIDELTIQFTPHFSVITGETGAGKEYPSLGAIALLMGQRADSSTIRPGAERCVIEARFTHLDAAVGANARRGRISIVTRKSASCAVRSRPRQEPRLHQRHPRLAPAPQAPERIPHRHPFAAQEPPPRRRRLPALRPRSVQRRATLTQRISGSLPLLPQ